MANCKGRSVNALVSGGDEGGGRPPKASGSCLSNYDPKMSEWGNPV